jgi:membrane associated rhomboid family serine protease
MFIPLHDDTPLRIIRFQIVTLVIIALNVAIFLYTGATRSEAMANLISAVFGVIPVELLHPAPAFMAALNPIPEPLTLLSYMFLHAGWLHLISNMLFLWVFGDNVEDAFGYVGFLLFYILCGVAAALTHVLMEPTSTSPLIGASGAVSGVLAAYMLLYPKARVWILLFMRIPLRIPALWVLGGWFALQIASLFMLQPGGQQVALWAHIGGFIAGLVLTLILRSRLLVRPPPEA